MTISVCHHAVTRHRDIFPVDAVAKELEHLRRVRLAVVVHERRRPGFVQLRRGHDASAWCEMTRGTGGGGRGRGRRTPCTTPFTARVRS